MSESDLRPGTILLFHRNAVLPGWAECDGAEGRPDKRGDVAAAVGDEDPSGYMFAIKLQPKAD